MSVKRKVTVPRWSSVANDRSGYAPRLTLSSRISDTDQTDPDQLRVLDVLLHRGHQLRRRLHAVLRLGMLGRALQDLLLGLTADHVPAAGGRVHLPAIDHLRHRRRLLSRRFLVTRPYTSRRLE